MKNNKGFSLVELIVVIAIMAILAAVAIPTFAGFIGKAQEASDESYLNDIEYAVELHLAKDGGIPATTTLKIELTTANNVTKVSKIILDDTDNTKDAELTLAQLEGVIDANYEMKKLPAGTYVSDGEGNWSVPNAN